MGEDNMGAIDENAELNNSCEIVKTAGEQSCEIVVPEGSPESNMIRAREEDNFVGVSTLILNTDRKQHKRRSS